MNVSKLKQSLCLLVLGMGMAILVAPIAPNKVFANHQPQCNLTGGEEIYGLDPNCGYFLNEYYAGSGFGLLRGIPSPWTSEGYWEVDNVDEFVAVTRYHLNVNGGCVPGPGGDRARNSAAFIVLTMLGAPVHFPANGPCISSQYSFARWESIVRQYDAAGLADFNAGNTRLNGWYTRNTRIQGILPDPAWYVDPNCVLPDNPLGFCAVPSIVFRAGPFSGPLYMIKKDCANPIDIPAPLPPLTHGFSVTPTANTVPIPDTEAPTSARFETGASYTGSPSITTYDRKYFYIKYGTVAEVTIQDPLPVTRTNTGTSATFAPVTLSIAGLGLTPGDQVCARNVVTPGAGTADPSGNVISVSDASNTSGNRCFTIVSRPYHQVYGGDTRAGSGFLTDTGDCSAATHTAARIIGWNRDGTPNYTGAGSQLATFTFDAIVFFASGQLRSTSPKHLSYANVNPSRSNLGGTTYGGGLMNGQSVCAPDHYDDGVDEATVPLGGSTSANISENIYSRTGPLTITGGNLGLGTGSRIIYVDGDVTITGNITYASGGYNNIDQIPGFRLVVQGNIYVESGVTQLDGIYIAQPRPDGTRGRFYTCAPGGAPPDVGEMNGVCRTNKLTIYGAVLADLIKFTRSGGTVSQSINHLGQLPTQASTSSTAAEVIIMTPEAWLVSDFASGGELDAITTLPPVL